MHSTWRRWIARTTLIAATSVIGFLILMALFLTACQRKLIYFPRPYTDTELRYLPAGMVKLEFETRQGKQAAFYQPPKGQTDLPNVIWIVFNGNATNALDWLDFTERTDERLGILLFDYPGYGISQGKPSRESIHETTEGAYAALLKHLGTHEKTLEGRVCILGQSLGAAVGLEFATAHKIRRIILLSPFTSLRDMGRMVVGWPLCQLIADRFDNRESLRKLAALSDPPEIFLFHGTADDVVPVRMGRQLAKEFPDLITYEDVPNVDHVWITDAVREKLYELMKRDLALDE